MNLLLASGLPLDRPSSFFRQLSLLADRLRNRGHHVTVTGPDTSRGDDTGTSQTGRQAGDRFDGAILLGYPDQFHCLRENLKKIPLFLWAQFSKPPRAGILAGFRTVPLTDRTARFIRDSGALPGPVIPHGIDTGVLRPLGPAERTRIRNRYGLEGLTAGCVGANTGRKRFDLLLKSFSLFLSTVKKGTLIIKTDRVRSREDFHLSDFARKLGVGSNVVIIDGEISTAELCEIYNAMDVYLSLSEWEGFCIPVIEAMACGTPVITHPVQGPGETVPYGDLMLVRSEKIYEDGTALLYADIDEAAEILMKARADPGLLARLSEEGRKYSTERFDMDNVAALWENLIADVLRHYANK